jgi:hypothetical protein
MNDPDSLHRDRIQEFQMFREDILEENSHSEMIYRHVSPLMYGPDSFQEFRSLALREFQMFVLGKLPKRKSSK